jgi:hypothetical protein
MGKCIMSFALAVALLVLGVIAFRYRQRAKQLQREAFIRAYAFAQGLLARFAERRPGFTLKAQQLVSRGLRK